MNYHLVIVAGGLGTRLGNTENMPKPLVDINGLSLISRIILAFDKTKLFKQFHILTCFNKQLFKKVIDNEISSLNVKIYEEGKRTGRFGALKYFIEIQNEINNFFVCNGDTIFLDLKRDQLLSSLEDFNGKPIIYLSPKDNSRSDYKEVKVVLKKSEISYQNSGLFFTNREWIENSYMKNSNLSDIDEHLFLNKDSIGSQILSGKIIDGGTPDRILKIRNSFNEYC